MSDKELYRRALREIKRRIDTGEDDTSAASGVVDLLRISDEAMSESLHEEAFEYAENIRDDESDSFACSCDSSMRDTHGVGAF